ncbi:MAG: exo-alpha-sialidase [bacterium]|nr:exo-alpha-sialidase [bacterium]
MPVIILPTPLTSRAAGRDRIAATGSTVGECLLALERDYPGLKGWVLDDRGRIRRHVNVFVGDTKATLDRTLAAEEEIYVIQAISGGGADLEETGEVLVGTKKGLIVLRGPRGRGMETVSRQFPGQVVEYATRDPRTGLYYASVTHGQFGPHVYLAEDPVGEWEQADGPVFPEGTDASVNRVWVIKPGVEEGVLWAGVAPAALFKSEDSGRTWELNRGLWDHPTRPDWEGGLGGLCLHSICQWPDDAQRLTLAISAVGVWQTEDGGESWSRYSEGLVPRYLPEEARVDTLMHCVHKLEQSPVEPDTFYMQFHGGVYRSDDAGHSWQDIAGLQAQGNGRGLPADFGFPIVVDPRDPNRAYVIPLVADVDRVTPEGGVRVFETRDRGASWQPKTQGLPQQDAYLTVLRQAFCHDGGDPLGLYFGAESGTVFGSRDGGETRSAVAENLPPIGSVRASQ